MHEQFNMQGDERRFRGDSGGSRCCRSIPVKQKNGVKAAKNVLLCELDAIFRLVRRMQNPVQMKNSETSCPILSKEYCLCSPAGNLGQHHLLLS